jgi:ribonuclease Z
MRYPSSLALRLRSRQGSHVWLFDAGEGALAQMQRSHLKASQLRHIFITHMHADHVFGLPGVILAALHLRGRAGNSSSDSNGGPSAVVGEPLTVYGPPGLRAFLRATLGTTLPNLRDGLLRIVELTLPEETHSLKRYKRQSPYWNAPIKQLPFEEQGGKCLRAACHDSPGGGPRAYTYNVLDFGAPERPMLACGHEEDTRGHLFSEEHGSSVQDTSAPASVQAAIVNHSVPSVAYVITEDVRGVRFDKAKLLAYGLEVDGNPKHLENFRSLLRGDSTTLNGRLIRPEDVVRDRRPRRLCVVGDTCDASGVAHLAQDVDVLVHEATVCAAETHIARKRGHSSSRTAAEFAQRIGARRLVLNHTSVGYTPHQVRRLEAEARAVLGFERAYIAYDMSVFNVPRSCAQVGDNFSFRTFLGHPRWDSYGAADEGLELLVEDGRSDASNPECIDPCAGESELPEGAAAASTQEGCQGIASSCVDDEDTTLWNSPAEQQPLVPPLGGIRAIAGGSTNVLYDVSLGGSRSYANIQSDRRLAMARPDTCVRGSVNV